MTGAVQAILARYGQAVTVKTAEGETQTRAFLQPVTELGWMDRRLWRYLGTAALAPGDTVAWGELRFRVRSSRPYCIGERLHHWWASLEREREAV